MRRAPKAMALAAPASPDSGPQPGLSQMLRQLAEDHARPRIAVADMLEAMRSRAFGALLIIFAFPNILPSPPGLAGLLGLPLLFLSVQMTLGSRPWLPGIIARRSMSRAVFAGMVARIEPWLLRAEGLMRQRLPPLSGPLAQRLIGALCLVLALALALPIPFANLAPAAAICLFGMGILQRDGLWILLSCLAAAAALTYVGALGYAVVKSAGFMLQAAS